MEIRGKVFRRRIKEKYLGGESRKSISEDNQGKVSRRRIKEKYLGGESRKSILEENQGKAQSVLYQIKQGLNPRL